MATIVVTYFRQNTDQNTDKYSTASAGDRQVSARDRGMAIAFEKTTQSLKFHHFRDRW